MRLGFVLGFLAGAGAAVVASTKTAEAPASPERALEEGEESARGLIGKVRGYWQSALNEARVAANEREAEMHCEFEETLRQARSTRPRRPY